MENTTALPLFSVDKKDVVLVKPSKPTPATTLSLSTLDSEPNLDLLCQTIYVFKANPISPQNPACVIREALSNALVYYYPLAGKLIRESTSEYHGRLQIDCEDPGVPFIEATTNCDLSALHYLDGVDVQVTEQFVFDINATEKDCSVVSHPLVLQVTKFSCGGFTIATGVSHSVCDGYGASLFYKALTELASGMSEPSVKPVWERDRLVGTRLNQPVPPLVDAASAATSPFWPTTDLLHEILKVERDSITRLKQNLTKETDHESFTTVEALGAYVWRSRTKALKLSFNGETRFFLTIGARNLMNPPLPQGYYGNAFVGSRHAVITVRDLIEGPLSAAARLIKQSKKMAAEVGHIENTLDMFETLRQQNNARSRTGGTGASVVLTEWRQLGLLEEFDFGWKQSVNVVPLPWDMFGYVDLCIFLPPSKLDPSMRGGVRVMVSLPRDALPVFREEMEKLKLGIEGRCD